LNKLIIPKEVSLNTLISHDKRVGKERNGIRTNCDYKCLLQHDDIMYPCMIKNISISGALVCALEVIPYHIQLKDTCNILLTSDHTLSSGEYNGKVVRLEHPNIALQFMGIGF
jgi:hypothetical protein